MHRACVLINCILLYCNEANGWEWIQRFDLHPTGMGSSLFSYYFGIDCDGLYTDEECFKRSEFLIHKIIERDLSNSSNKSSSSNNSKIMIKSYLVIGQSKKEKMFCMEYNLYSNSIDSLGKFFFFFNINYIFL